MDETQVVAIVEGEVAASIGRPDGLLSAERKIELDYYLGNPLGNEQEGESAVVSTDVADTVEGLLPILINIFAASDDAVRFDPQGPEDEEAAKQRTDVCNYVFYRQNPGFLILYEWFKDALINKNGIVRYWWVERYPITTETYQGLSEGEYLTLKKVEGNVLEVEVLKESSYPDPSAVEKVDTAKQQLTQMLSVPQMHAQAAQMLAQIDATPLPKLYDCTLRFKRDESQICIKAIPPEEFGISAKHASVSIQETPFCYQKSRKSASDLKADGCPDEIIARAGSDSGLDLSPEAIIRDRFLDQSFRAERSSDESSKELWVTESFIRLDEDEDGIAELRHIILVEHALWIDEESDHINFAALTPIIMPHRWVGRSVAELVMDIQFTKSVLSRQMLNNLYLTNNPRKAVLSSASGQMQANLDDLLTSRPGGIMREYVPNAIRNEEIPFVAGASFPMLEYLDSVKENRTGITRYNQGTDADTLNKTARGISLIQTAGAQRTNLIARIFAETGVKDLFRGIAYLLSRYSTRNMTLKLRNQWVEVDPREWKSQFNMTVNVGLGTGNKDEVISQLAKLGEMHVELMKEGRGYMVSDENVYNLYRKMSEAMGFKHPELFISDPQKVQKPPPQPNVDMLKIQADTQSEQQKVQLQAQLKKYDVDMTHIIEDAKAKVAMYTAQLDATTRKEIERMRAEHKAQLAIYDKSGSTADKSTELALREMNVKHMEDMLAQREQAGQVVGEVQKTVMASNDEKHAMHSQIIVQALTDAINKIAQQSGFLGNLLSQIHKTAVAQLDTSQKALSAETAEKKVSISNIQTDGDGRITGATVKPTLQ